MPFDIPAARDRLSMPLPPMTHPPMDLQAALAFSAYADRAFTAEPELRGEIDATLAREFGWTAATQALD
ncbi:MAG: hypothetical protein WA900_08375, partial [Casimicrobiaceae bacterium]